MQQWQWLELIKDYDLEVHYRPGKANVVAVRSAIRFIATISLLSHIMRPYALKCKS